MTELDPLIKAFVKTLEEATSTQFECLRIVMDSGTVGGWEAMHVVHYGVI